MTNVVEVIITGPRHMIHDLVTALVHERLIAGGHLMPIESTYRWEGAIHETEETRAAMHTTQALVDPLMQRIRREHPYQVPCIVVTPFAGGSPDYLGWVETQTEPDAPAT